MEPKCEAFWLVRAMLRGDLEEQRRLERDLHERGYRGISGEFLVQLFQIAVVSRFHRAENLKVIQFISQVRARVADPVSFDPAVAEALISAALGREPLPAGLTWNATVPMQLLLLTAITGGANLGDDALDRMMVEAERLANQPSLVPA